MTIDTLAYAKHREGAGVDRRMAEAHAEAMAHHVFPQLVAKSDLDKAVSEIKLWLVLTTPLVAGLAVVIAKSF